MGGHDFSFDEKRIGGVAIVQDGTPLPETRSQPRSTPTPFCSAQSAATNSIRCPPTNALKLACLQIRAALGGFANLRPCFSFKELTVNSPLAP